MLGGKFRDKIPLYADTESSPDPAEMAKRLNARVSQGFKFLKIDLNIAQLGGTENVVRPPPMSPMQFPRTMGDQRPRTPHQFTGVHVTEKGLRAIEEYCAAVLERVGWKVPIATDHYGSFNVENIIKFARL